MKSRALVTVCGLLAAMTLGVPAALAARHYTVKPGYVTRLHLRASNAYRLSISTGYRHGVSLTARKEGTKTEYSATGAPLGRFGVEAKLADLGHIRFRFRATGARATGPRLHGAKAPTSFSIRGPFAAGSASPGKATTRE